MKLYVFYTGVSGDVSIDNNGDRDPDYSIWHIPSNRDKFVVWAQVRMTATVGQVFNIKNYDEKEITMLVSFILRARHLSHRSE